MLDKWLKIERLIISEAISSTPSELRKARLMAATCIFSGFACSALIVLGLMLSPEHLKPTLVVSFGHALVTLSFLTLRNAKSMKFPGWCVATLGTTQMVTAIFFSGGPQSPVLFIMPVAPIFFNIVSNTRHAIGSAITLTLSLFVVFAMNGAGYEFMAPASPLIILGTLVWAILTGLSVAWYADLMSNDLMDTALEEIKRRKAAQLAIEASSEKLRQALNQNDWYLAYVSHELRNALATVLSSSELLDNTEDSERTKKYLSILKHSSRNLGGLLDSILDFSALEAGELRFRHEPLIAQEIVEGVFLEFLPQAQQRKISLELKMETSEHFKILSDQNRLTQVLRNLISNAIKYAPASEICVLLTRQGSYAVFAVSDTGPGIPPELRSAIFQPYERLDNQVAKGTGLGLAISDRIVTGLGSKLIVNTQMKKGSTFSFRIPIKQITAALNHFSAQEQRDFETVPIQDLTA